MKLSEKIHGLIASNKISEAIQEYLVFFKDKQQDLYQECLLYSARYKKMSQENRMGLLDPAQFNLQSNQLNFALLSLLDQTEDQELAVPEKPTKDSTIKIFISYAHENEHHMERLRIHLEPLKQYHQVEAWNDTLILPGENWDQSIKSAFAASNFILILISADYLSSTYCGMEMRWALDSDKIVIPIIVEPCSWDLTALSSLQALPSGAKAISLWENQEEAYSDITAKIRVRLNRGM